MIKIYAVCSYVDFEGSEIIKAFLKRETAKAFQQQCEEYHKTKRDAIDIDAWLEKHPAGYRGYSVDGYTTKTVDFDAS